MVEHVGAIPDVVYVELHHHPTEWSVGEAAEVYKFRCLGRAWGATRWVVHAVWANKVKPTLSTPRPFAMAILRQLISDELSQKLRREIPQWDNDLLAWEDRDATT